MADTAVTADMDTVATVMVVTADTDTVTIRTDMDRITTITT